MVEVHRLTTHPHHLPLGAGITNSAGQVQLFQTDAATLVLIYATNHLGSPPSKTLEEERLNDVR